MANIIRTPGKVKKRYLASGSCAWFKDSVVQIERTQVALSGRGGFKQAKFGVIIDTKLIHLQLELAVTIEHGN
jgi:hypothetical protein